MSASISLQPGVLFHERYRVVRCIKRGGMGAVFEVLDERTTTHRALKVMLPDVVDDGDLRARFEREARVTGVVESDHVVRVTDAGVDAATDTPFLVMEYLRGSDLGALMGERRLSPEEVVRYLGQAALGLDRAHAAGIVHRDLKPENLFLTRRDDGSACVKVLDFGIAKIVARRTQAKDTRTMGTPTYMAPEQIRGEGTIGPRADVYAVAHIAYALLVGEEYWREEARRAGSAFAFFSRVVEGLPESPSVRALRMHGVALGDGFDRWLKRAAAGAPEDRFASAGAAVAALALALAVAPPPGIAHETLVSASAEPGEGSPERRADAPTLVTDVDAGPPTIEDPRDPVALDTVPTAAWSQPTAPSARSAASEPLSTPAPEQQPPGPLAIAPPRRGSIRLPIAALVAFGAVALAAWIVRGPTVTPPPPVTMGDPERVLRTPPGVTGSSSLGSEVVSGGGDPHPPGPGGGAPLEPLPAPSVAPTASASARMGAPPASAAASNVEPGRARAKPSPGKPPGRPLDPGGPGPGVL